MTSTETAVASSATTRSVGASSSRLLGGIGALLIIAGAGAILVLHVVGPTSLISWYRRTISEYAYTSSGWVFDAGVVLISAGSTLVVAGLLTAGLVRWTSPAVFALLAWAIGLVVLVLFPKHDWSVGPSAHGQIHRVASLIAFLSVPIAALVIGIRHRRRTAAKAAIAFGALSGALLACIIGAFLVGPAVRTAWWQVFPLGLMERGIALFAVLAVLSLAALTRSVVPAPAGVEQTRAPGQEQFPA